MGFSLKSVTAPIQKVVSEVKQVAAPVTKLAETAIDVHETAAKKLFSPEALNTGLTALTGGAANLGSLIGNYGLDSGMNLDIGGILKGVGLGDEASKVLDKANSILKPNTYSVPVDEPPRVFASASTNWGLILGVGAVVLAAGVAAIYFLGRKRR